MASMRFSGLGVETVVRARAAVAAAVEVTDTVDVVDSEVMDVGEDEEDILVAEPVVDVAQTNPKLLHQDSHIRHGVWGLVCTLGGFSLACFAASMAKRYVTALHVL